MKVRRDDYEDKIIIVLESDEEKHVMWHLLNIDDAKDVREYSSDLDMNVFDNISRPMFDSYHKVANEYEQMPKVFNTVRMQFIKRTDGKAVYKCMVCDGQGCALCNGIGYVKVTAVLPEPKK